MVNLLTKICIVATCAMMVVAAPSGSPVSAPAEAADCSSLVFDLIDCMDFLVAGGNETAPDRSCCLGFKSLLVANEDCMCYALGTAAGLGLDINMTRAEALPSDCRISSPPIATCHAQPSSLLLRFTHGRGDFKICVLHRRLQQWWRPSFSLPRVSTWEDLTQKHCVRFTYPEASGGIRYRPARFPPVSRNFRSPSRCLRVGTDLKLGRVGPSSLASWPEFSGSPVHGLA
ncbi:hypothetical protein ACS0TY_013450 [Phlomoides rotata]